LKLTICARTGNRAGLFRADRSPPAVSAYVPAKTRSTVDKIGGVAHPASIPRCSRNPLNDSIVVNNINNSPSLHRNMKIRKTKIADRGLFSTPDFDARFRR
jgi:hypothetical protein